MAINIKDPETDRVARELAKELGVTITDALKVAAEDYLRRLRRQRSVTGRQQKLHAYIERGRARRTLDDRPAEEIVGYDDAGLPA